MPHFIVSPPLAENGSVTITGADVHHIRNVLRLKPGDEITVSSGSSGKFACEIAQIEKDQVTAIAVRKLSITQSAVPATTLAQSAPKARKMDDIVRMACEMGVVKIIPVIAERSLATREADVSASKLDRWRAIALSAARQCGSPGVAEITAPVSLHDLPSATNASLRIVFWEGETKSLKSVLDDAPRPDSIIALIGPEGGFSRDEVDFLVSKGFKTASLGVTTLRTETAGIVALSAIHHHFG
ncbi:MAG: 16S rRNA (uracil(1498)-N(3))-methyltransferase [Nitrospinae bacterium]|nr:16S rRNA (uracil(1498)-N(3))-methyltransferase [Nitrospinota bacterium]